MPYNNKDYAYPLLTRQAMINALPLLCLCSALLCSALLCSALLCSALKIVVISQLFVNMKVYLLIPTLDKIILISFFKYSFGSIFFIAKSKPFSKFSKKNILDDGILDGYSN